MFVGLSRAEAAAPAFRGAAAPRFFFGSRVTLALRVGEEFTEPLGINVTRQVGVVAGMFDDVAIDVLKGAYEIVTALFLVAALRPITGDVVENELVVRRELFHVGVGLFGRGAAPKTAQA